MAQSHSWLASKALAKATLALLNPKIWGLSLLPFLIASAVWAGLGFMFWDDAFAQVGLILSQISLPVWLTHWLPGWLMTIAESSRTVWVPFAMLILVIPGVLLTVLALVGMLGVSFVARGVGVQYGLTPLSTTVLRQGLGLLSSIWHSVWVLIVLLLVWVLTLPLWLIPGLGFVVPMVIIAWVNSKLFTFDVLTQFASQEERKAVTKQHRGTLWVLGFIASIPTFIPSVLWLSGAVFVFFLPLFAALSVWLYVMVFLGTASLFSHYLLPALKHDRDTAAVQTTQAAAAKDAQALEVEVRELAPTLATLPLQGPETPKIE